MTAYPHVAFDSAGCPVIAGTKVPVHRLWFWHRRGVTFETLVKRYGQLGPAKILSAVAFAYDNQELIEKYETEERAFMEKERELEQLKLPRV